MANGHGGHRTPQNPAPVSGPGALSRRTDGGPTQPVQIAPGGPYGSRQDMEQIQTGAPMAATGGSATTPGAASSPSLAPFDAPTARPDEPITAGMNSVPNVQPTQIDDSTRQRLQAAMPTLLWLASQPKASEQTRQFVRQVRGDL